MERFTFKDAYKITKKLYKKNRIKLVIDFYLHTFLRLLTIFIPYVSILASLSYSSNYVCAINENSFNLIESLNTLEDDKKVKKAFKAHLTLYAILSSALLFIVMLSSIFYLLALYLFKISNNRTVYLIPIISFSIMALLFIFFIFVHVIPSSLTFEYDSEISVNRSVRLSLLAYKLKNNYLYLEIIIEFVIYLMLGALVYFLFKNSYFAIIAIILLFLYIIFLPRLAITGEIYRTKNRLNIMDEYENYKEEKKLEVEELFTKEE